MRNPKARPRKRSRRVSKRVFKLVSSELHPSLHLAKSDSNSEWTSAWELTSAPTALILDRRVQEKLVRETVMAPAMRRLQEALDRLLERTLRGGRAADKESSAKAEWGHRHTS